MKSYTCKKKGTNAFYGSFKNLNGIYFQKNSDEINWISLCFGNGSFVKHFSFPWPLANVTFTWTQVKHFSRSKKHSNFPFKTLHTETAGWNHRFRFSGDVQKYVWMHRNF